MAQNEQKTNAFQAKLCIKCMDMYGNPSFQDMCSVCFRKVKAEQKLETFKKLQEPLVQTPQKQVKPEIKQEPVESKKRPLPTEQVKVVGRCGKCSKKTGIYGLTCKHCNSQYCKFHRLPEDHDCQMDFITLGRKQIKMDNPVIAKKKIEQI